MIEIQFFLQNAHFALNLFAALIFFAAAWLYFDAWLIRKGFKESLKIAGLFLLCLSFVAHATILEQTILSTPVSGEDVIASLDLFLRIVGYILLCAGLISDPLQKKPDEVRSEMPSPAAGVVPGMGLGSYALILTPIL